MSALRVFAASSLCGLILCLPAAPQQTTPPPTTPPPAAPQPDPARVQFRGSATEVIVPVTVTDDKGRPGLCCARSGGMVKQAPTSRVAPPRGAALSTAGRIAGLAARGATRVFGGEPETTSQLRSDFKS